MVVWNEQTLGEICDQGNGIIRTGPFGSQLHQSDYSDYGIPVVMPKDIILDKISDETIARVSTDHVERLAQHKLSQGDIVYGRRGDIGRQALVRYEQEGWLCGTGCLRITLGKSQVDSTFLHYYLQQSHVISWIYNQAVGSTMPNLNTSILRSVPIKHPPLVTQRKIAAILSAYDDLIENNQRRIKILEEMAHNLYREWFVKFRFPGHENVAMVDSPLGLIPEGWEVKRLGDVCTLVMGQSPKSEFYNTQREGLPFHQGVTNFGDRYPKNQIYSTSINRIAQRGDILFSVRAPVGRINIATEKIVIGRGLSAIRDNQNYQWFIFHALKDKFTEDDLIGSGTIFKSVTKEDIEKILCIYPNEDIHQKFKKSVNSLENQIETLTRKKTNLRQTRDMLLPKLISGEIDVSDLDIRIPEEGV